MWHFNKAFNSDSIAILGMILYRSVYLPSYLLHKWSEPAQHKLRCIIHGIAQPTPPLHFIHQHIQVADGSTKSLDMALSIVSSETGLGLIDIHISGGILSASVGRTLVPHICGVTMINQG